MASLRGLVLQDELAQQGQIGPESGSSTDDTTPSRCPGRASRVRSPQGPGRRRHALRCRSGTSDHRDARECRWGPSSWGTCPSPRVTPRSTARSRRPSFAETSWSSSTPIGRPRVRPGGRLQGRRDHDGRQGRLEASGVEFDLRQLVRGFEPAEDLISVAEANSADLIVIGLRRVARRQAHPRQQRPAHPARRPLRRPGGQGGRLTAVALRRRLHITGDEHADQLLTDDPFALLVGMLLDQQYPMEHAFRGRPRSSTGSALWTPRRSRRPTRRSSRRWPRPRRRSTASPVDGRRRCRRSRQIVTDDVRRRAERLWTEATAGKDLLARVMALPGFGKQKAQIFIAAAGQAARRPARGLGAGRRRLRRGTATARWRTSSTPSRCRRCATSRRPRRRPRRPPA